MDLSGDLSEKQLFEWSSDHGMEKCNYLNKAEIMEGEMQLQYLNVTATKGYGIWDMQPCKVIFNPLR